MMKHRNSPHARVNLLAAAVLAVVLLAALYQGGRWLERQGEQPQTRGNHHQRYAYERQLSLGGTAYRYRKDLTTLLILGVDSDAAMGAAGYRNGSQADFLWLVVVDATEKKVTKLQLDRDTMAEVQLYGPFGDKAGTRRMQLCLSYAYGDGVAGKCGNVADAVSHLLSGITIDGVVALDMGGIAAFNDALGGVTVTLETDLTRLDAALEKGKTVTLSDEQAEAFVRGRRGVDDGTNHARMQRQRLFMDAAETQLREQAARSHDFLNTLLEKLNDHLYTSMSRGWLINVANACLQYDTRLTQSLEGEYRLGEDGFVEFHADEDALQALLIQIFLKPIDP